MSARRLQLLNEIKAKGVNVVSLFVIYGPERDAHIAAARAVLNLHVAEGYPLEQVRCYYPLTNSVPVISERYASESAPPCYERSLFLAGDEPMVDFVARTLANRAEFSLGTFRRVEWFRSLDPLPEFGTALEDALARHHHLEQKGRRAMVPARMNLGYWSGYRLGYLNIDVDPAVKPDILLDLSRPIEWPMSVVSRYGNIVLTEGIFDEIVAQDVLQRVPDLRRVMSHCLYLLKVGGRLEIEVPYDLSFAAWDHPECRRVFNELSWSDFTEKFWNTGWLDYRFDCIALRFVYSSLGRRMELSAVASEDIRRVPRAVEALILTLVKRPTTDEEKQLARARDPDFHLKQARKRSRDNEN
jgi:SAM-dependent methyltransferase